ncbi:SAM-dependent methyltransferase [Pleionea mediterranea]|uniref:Tetrapyrrole (Corrin/porphyrin) methylase-like protein n=1 Tax=Pleionea mediterranea TaxID=523701 RepID=A0A316GFA3_9GAMM|nr:SAM-dependent methyltransferase [Pleionea mediterranea]PWK53367.1 tetrapyrrole (corrin/porphyrin) methylase-like protein [Pleionea mediterranea]
MPDGRLTVVGTGLITPQHITQEAKRHIELADRVYHLVPDPLGISFLRSLNSNLVYLGDCYQKTDNRAKTYSMMAQRILQGVREELNVVAVFYGHPGVFVSPSHQAIKQARKEGYDATMLPGVSAESCLYADLDIDPGKLGAQNYEATYFLCHKININLSAPLTLWQLGVVGDLSFSTKIKPSATGLYLLKQKLMKHYPDTFEVILYETAIIPAFAPRIKRKPLEDIQLDDINEVTTLYLPEYIAAQKDDYFCTELETKTNQGEKSCQIN